MTDHKQVVEDYIAGVMSGEIIAGRLVKLAVRRQLDDLEHGHERGLHFDEDTAFEVCNFFPTCLRHYIGEWAGDPFELTPFQTFVTWVLFGWKRENGFRRFRKALVSMARKGGKTTWCGGVGTYGAVADDPIEEGAEIYIAATHEKQAKIMFGDCSKMVSKSPSINRIATILKDNIAFPSTSSYIRVLGSEPKNNAGWRPHFALLDEVCDWREHHRDYWGAIVTAMGNRRQPLRVVTCTYGDETSDIWLEENEYAKAVLDSVLTGQVIDDAYFAMIATLDERRPCEQCSDGSCGQCEEGIIPEDDCFDESNWCLSSDTQLYARISKGVTVATVQDIVKKPNPSDIELWDGRRWVKVLGWSRASCDDKRLKITLRSGQSISCTAHHEWPTSRGKVRADELRLGDVVKSTTLPDTEDVKTDGIADDIGWIVGLYLAEGSKTREKQATKHRRKLQFSCREGDRQKWTTRLSELAQRYHGTCHSHLVKKNTGAIVVESPVLMAIVDMYVGGNCANKKYIRPRTWRMSNVFLGYLADAYLEGDGGNDPCNDRSRLGFCRNDRLASGLRTLAARLGASIRLAPSTSTCEGKVFPTYTGEWRWKKPGRTNACERGEIIKIAASKGRVFWHLGVDNEDGLFALASGVLTHNSKANPNLGYTIQLDYLRDQATEAKHKPSALRDFKRYHCNMLVTSSFKVIDMNRWSQGNVELSDWSGQPVYGAYDIAWGDDLASIALATKFFDGEDENHNDRWRYEIRSWSFICEECKLDLNREPWATCIENGCLSVNRGSTTDIPGAFKRKILEVTEQYGVVQWAHDIAGATHLAIELMNEHGIECFKFPQTHAMYTPAFKLYLDLIHAGLLVHGGDRLLEWTARHLVANEDHRKKIMPDKQKSKEKIDPQTATIMAIGGAMTAPVFHSYYENNLLEMG